MSSVPQLVSRTLHTRNRIRRMKMTIYKNLTIRGLHLNEYQLLIRPRIRGRCTRVRGRCGTRDAGDGERAQGAPGPGEDRRGGAAAGRFGHRYDPEARAEAQVSALRSSGARLMGSATLVGAVGAPRASKIRTLGLAFVPLWSQGVSDGL